MGTDSYKGDSKGIGFEEKFLKEVIIPYRNKMSPITSAEEDFSKVRPEALAVYEILKKIGDESRNVGEIMGGTQNKEKRYVSMGVNILTRAHLANRGKNGEFSLTDEGEDYYKNMDRTRLDGLTTQTKRDNFAHTAGPEEWIFNHKPKK